MNALTNLQADDSDETVTVDELLDADLEYGDELTITYTITKRHGRDRRHPIEVTAQGEPQVTTYEDTGHTIVDLPVQKTTANYESYVLNVSDNGASVCTGEPKDPESHVLGHEASIEISDGVAETDELGRLIRAYLWDNDELLKDGFEGEHPLAGHCYVASEAYYHLSGRQDELTVCRVDVDGVTHWFLEDESAASDPLIDLTADQFDQDVPYDERVGTGFMTREPSKRAQTVIDALEGVVNGTEGGR